MKIAIATDAWHPQISGVVTTLSKTMEILRKRGCEVLCIHPGRFPLTIPCPTYPQIRLAVNPAKRLRQLLDRFQPHAIHCVTEGPIGLACRWYCRRHGLDFTTSFTTRFDEYVEMRSGIPGSLVFRFIKWFHSAASSVMISSDPLRNELKQKGIRNMVLWPRGVDTDLFRMRDKSFLKETRPIFIYVGRVAVEKNIEAFLSLDLPGTKCVVGNGPALNRLALKYAGARFFGAKEGVELARYFAAGDVLVFPSRTDTFGIVMLEAMACGVPVAGYPVRGPIDIVKQGVTGCIDQDLKKAALQALRLDPARCREAALSYSWEKSAQHFLKNLVDARADKQNMKRAA